MLETPRKVKNIFLNNSYNKIANVTIYLTMKLILNNIQSRKKFVQYMMKLYFHT